MRTCIYQLPFGRTGQFLNHLNPVADRLIGGWEATGFYSFQTGFPLNFTGADYFLNSGNIVLDTDERTLTRVQHRRICQGFRGATRQPPARESIPVLQPAWPANQQHPLIPDQRHQHL